MAKNRVIFNRYSGQVVGFLDKELFKVFEQQRDMECYHIVKMSEKEVDEAFEYHDMATYSPMFIDDIIVFPHEEMTCAEIAYENFEMTYNIIGKAVTNIIDSFVFEKDEESIVKTALGTILVKYAQYSDGEDEDVDDIIDYNRGVIEVLKSFGLREDM